MNFGNPGLSRKLNRIRLLQMRKRIKINGTVQGVGFRPFVFRTAINLNICGYVTNTDTGVLVEAQGDESAVSSFQDVLVNNAPPLSEISEIQTVVIPDNGDMFFSINPTSKKQKNITTAVSPDVATCSDCLSDISDPFNRRNNYPFTNCTNCGPRYSIISDMPYDRPSTTMRDFHMCPECHGEYTEPLDRRFHAQPNACPVCGPVLSLLDRTGRQVKSDNPIADTVALLNSGQVVAIKGLGGFHLAVDATSDEAVKLLRKRKFRAEKPFAIMTRNISVVNSICEVNHMELEALRSFQAPIVLLDKKQDGVVSGFVAPDSRKFGVMLPYTPLHHLIFMGGIDVLVMTSANRSEEPICINNDEAVKRLYGIADYFLVHNRDILIRSDDSILQEMAGKMRLIRRSRGHVPKPFYLKNTNAAVLGAGSDLKNTFCMVKGNKAVMSQYIGDLENILAVEFFKETYTHLRRIHQFKPELIVHDLHPGFHSTKWALDSGVQVLAAQHHHAHLAAVCGEFGLDEPVIGLIMDGTGYGQDKTIWGGEILIGNAAGYSRYASFEEIALPGGDSAIRNPWKTGLSYLRSAFGSENIPSLPFMDSYHWMAVVEAIDKHVNTVPTSSAGRLFDAVAAISGVRSEITYEAQAAIELMNCCVENNTEPYSIEINDYKGRKIICTMEMIREITKDVIRKKSKSYISSRFHIALIKALSEAAISASRDSGIKKVILSGGVFQNYILLNGLVTELESQGLENFIPEKFPLNDGGISFGQALIGLKFLNKGAT